MVNAVSPRVTSSISFKLTSVTEVSKGFGYFEVKHGTSFSPASGTVSTTLSTKTEAIFEEVFRGCG